MIDFHCHLDLYPEPTRVRDECVRRGMYLLSVTTTPSAWIGTSSLSGGDSKIRTSIGLHPQLARERRSELYLVDSHISKTKYVGEIGLDGSPEYKPFWMDQIAVFEYILTKCRESGGKILSLHSRRASTAVLDCLSLFPDAGVPVLHWFTGNRRELLRAIDLGCWFSIGPTMLSSERGRGIAQVIPKERVLTESDGPFAQIGGQAVMPWDVHRATTTLSTIWGVSERAADTQLLDNLRSLTSFIK
jgi:TatD DNase family protein